LTGPLKLWMLARYGQQCLAITGLSMLAVAATLASAQPLPNGGYTIRSPQPFGPEEAVTWQVVSATADSAQLILQIAGSAEPLTISPWPVTSTRRHGGRMLGLPQQQLPRGGVKLTAVQTIQPFGPAQRLSVQHGVQSPSLVVQTRAQSGQAVVAGWRAVLAGDRWLLQNDASHTTLDASRTQRIRSAKRIWCVYPSARPAGPEGQESPALLDWVLMAAPAKGRC
jgi:hypothetical protein